MTRILHSIFLLILTFGSVHAEFIGRSSLSSIMRPERTELQSVAGPGHMNYSFLTVTTQTSMICRFPVLFGGPVTKFSLAFDNGYLDALGGWTQLAQQITILGAAFEANGTATVVPFTFDSGALSKTLALDAVKYRTDDMSSSLFGISQFAGDWFGWLRIEISIPAAGDIPYGASSIYAGSNCYAYDPANRIDQVYQAGILLMPSGATSRNSGYSPTAFLGRFNLPGYKSVLMWGDSIAIGIGDGAAPKAPTGRGIIARSALADGSSANGMIAFSRIARSGIKASQLLANTTVQTYFLNHNILVSEASANDLNIGGSASSIMTTLAATSTAFRSSGGERVIQTLPTGRTNSFNSWVNDVGQTYQDASIWGPTGVAQTLTNLMNAAVGTAFDATVDLTGFQSAANRWFWNSDGVALKYTADGIHDETAAAILGGVNNLRPAVQSMTVD